MACIDQSIVTHDYKHVPKTDVEASPIKHSNQAYNGNDQTADGNNDEDISPKAPLQQVLYRIDDVPPVHITVLLGIQHFLTMFGGVISLSLLVAQRLCMADEPVAISRLLATSFFVYGIVTLIQTTFGVRLPIIQGGAFSFVVPIFAISEIRGDCPVSSSNGSTNYTSMMDTSATEVKEYEIRIREIQGSLMVASCVQLIVGFTGIMGFILRFIGPLTIAPITALIGLSLFTPAAYESGLHWGIAVLTIGLIIIFSQYLSNVDIPCISYSNKGCRTVKFPLFKLFPIIIGILSAWIVCAILTATNVFTDNPTEYGYAARTDRNARVLDEAPWFAVPYPGQWGTPTVSLGGVFGIMAGVFASMIESVGDYYACARMSAAPPPPPHAVNRGIGIEGIGCILCGAFGTASGSTSFSENIGAIGITKVGSRVVVQAAGVVMVLLGLFTKFSAIFTTIPIPVVGGVLCCTFGMVTAVGVSNLQYVDLNSSRNLFVFGFSTLMGLVVPHWVAGNQGAIYTGVAELDQIFYVLLSTGMFVGGALAFFLDNTIPGTSEERGLLSWREQYSTAIDSSVEGDVDPAKNDDALQSPQSTSCYDLPLIMNYIRRWKWTRCLPFSPTYQGLKCRRPGPC